MHSHLVFLNDEELEAAIDAVGDAVICAMSPEYTAVLQKLKSKLKHVQGDEDQVRRVMSTISDEAARSVIAEYRSGRRIPAVKRVYVMLGRRSLVIAKRVTEMLVNEAAS